MAEFLIKAIDQIHIDPIKDRSGCWKQWDIVQIYEDGACKEPPAPKSKMYIIKVPGLSVESVNKYVESEVNEISAVAKVTRRRKWRFNPSGLSVEVLNALDKKEILVLSPDKFVMELKA